MRLSAHLGKWLLFVGLVLLALFPLLGSCKLADVLGGGRDKATEIATRLGVEPSWDAIGHYLDNAFQPGMSQEEVEAVLAKVAPYKTYDHGKSWDPDFGGHVDVVFACFTDQVVAMYLKAYTFSFDDQGQLVEFELIDLGYQCPKDPAQSNP